MIAVFSSSSRSSATSIILSDEREEEENLLDMIRGDIAGVVTSHHGLHLHQVLLHFFCYYI